MNRSLRILNVEDSERDSSLVLRHLEKAGYNVTWVRVETSQALHSALADQEWDLILCDYSMPRFSALAALAILRELGIDIPFIIISGTVGEEIAVEAMLSGANDYIPKDNLTRLIAAIERELVQAEDRRAKREAEEAMRESEERFAGAFEHAPIGVALVSPTGQWLKVNLALCDLLGYSETELLKLTFQEITKQDDLEASLQNLRHLLSGAIDHYRLEKRYVHMLGHDVLALTSVSLVRRPNGDPNYIIAQIQDITEQKEAEHQLQLDSLILNSIGQAVIVTDPKGNITYWNSFAEKLYGWQSYEVIGLNIIDVTPTDASREQAVEILESLIVGEQWSGEFTVQDRDGRSFPIFVTNTALKNAAGAVQSIIGVSNDVSERRQAEEKLRESESLLSNTQSIAHIGSWVMDISQSGEIVHDSERWSDEHYRIFGFEPGEIDISDDVFYECVHPDDRERLATTITEAIEKKAPFDIEHRIILPDGGERTVQAKARIHVDEKSGKPIKVIGSVQDITERKNAEEELRASEERYRSVVDTAGDVILTIDDSGTICFINPAAEKVFGYDIDELTGSPLSMLMPENFRHLHDAGMNRYQETGVKALSWENVEVVGLQKAGREIPITISFSEFVQKGRRYFTGIIRDITEQKRAEEALLANEDRLRTMVESLPQLAWMAEPDGTIFWFNSRWYEYTGTTFDEMADGGWSSVHDPGILPSVVVKWMASIESGDPFEMEFPLRGADGEFRWFLTRVNPLRDANGKIIRWLGTNTDVDGSRQIREELRASEERFAKAFNSSPLCITLTSIKTGRLVEVNDTFVKITGYSRDEAVGATTIELGLWAPSDRESELQTVTADGKIRDREYRFTIKDGSQIVGLLSAEILEIDGEKCALTVILDITESKKALVALTESEERYRELVENALDIIYTHDLQGNFTSVNKAAEIITGFTREDALVMNIADIVVPEYLEEARQVIYAKLAGEETTAYDLELITKNGRRISVEVNTRIIYENGVPVGVQGIARDITERKLAAEEIQEKSALLEAQLNSTIDGILIVDQYGKQIIRNDRFVDIFEMPPHIADDSDDATQVEWVTDLMKDPDKFVSRVEYLYANPEEISRDEIELKDGRVLDRYSAPVMSEDQMHYGRIWSFRDVTESMLAAAEKDRLLNVLEGSLNEIYIFDADTLLFEYVNECARRNLGYSMDAMRRLTPIDLKPEVTEADFRDLIQPLCRHEKSKIVFETVHRRADDSLYPVEVHLQLADRGGNSVFLAVINDITDRKAGEAARLASERKYQDLFTLAPVGIYQSRVDGTVMTANLALAQMLGYQTVDEFLGTNFADIYFDLDDRRKLFEKYGEAGVAGDVDIQWKRKDGSPIWIQLTAHKLKGPDVETEYYEGFVRDITKQKADENSLRESDEKFKQLADNISDVFWIRSPDMSKIYYISPAYERIWGRELKSDYADPHEWYEYIYPQDRQMVKDAYAGLMNDRSEIAVEFRILRPDGEERWVRARGFQVKDSEGEVIRLAGIVTDITERKQAQAEIERTLQRLTDAQRIGHIGDFTWDMTTGALTWSNEIFKIVGRDPELGPPKNYEEMQTYFDMPSIEVMDAKVALAIETGETQEYELTTVLQDGKRVIIQATSEPRKDQSGVVVGLSGTIQDITTRKRAEEALESAEEKYRSIFENAVEGICQSTLDGRFISANPATARILGFDSPEELIELRNDIGSQHYVDPATRVELGTLLEEHDVVAAYEAEVYKKDGNKIWTQENIRAIRGTDGQIRHYEGSIEDITARKSLEDQFRQSQKMEAVGVLAGGIAHDFNNLLTAINGFSDLTLRRMEPENPFRRNIQEIKNAGTRAAELTGQLLAFSRKQVLKPSVISLNTVISNIENMLRRIIRESVELRVVLDDKLGNVLADPGQVEQVIVNLAVNARDAMPDGGHLTIETENVYLGEPYVNQHLLVSPGEFVRITVSDNGEGMDAETQSHIFEPFFTTKEVGKGTGLGLPTVYGIVKQSGGTIMVYSEVGQGTTFKIYFPRVDKAVERPRWLGESEASYIGTETILLVEDEDAVRGFVTEVLESGGYTVLAAPDGPDAIAVCHEYSKPIHLLISDVIMPRMGGAELKKHVVELLPEIKVLFISGYTDDSIADRGIDDPNIAFLEKPFSPDSLIRKVREVLDDQAG